MPCDWGCSAHQPTGSLGECSSQRPCSGYRNSTHVFTLPIISCIDWFDPLQADILSLDLGIISHQDASLHPFTLNDACNLAFRKCQHYCYVALSDHDLSVDPSIYTNLDSYALITVDPSIHTNLDSYALIAVAPSIQTVNALLKMVKDDNDMRQHIMDQTGGCPLRNIDVSHY